MAIIYHLFVYVSSVACGTGQFRNIATNQCLPCPLNEYQDETLQTSCKSCGDSARYRTAATGSDSL